MAEATYTSARGQHHLQSASGAPGPLSGTLARSPGPRGADFRFNTLSEVAPVRPSAPSCAGASPRARAARITFVQSTVGPTGHFLARSRSRARPAFVSAEVGCFGVCFSVICALHCAGHLVCLARRCLCPARAVLCEPPPVRWPNLSVRWTWGSAASRPLGARRCASSCRHRARLRPHFPPASAREVVPPRGPRLRRTRKWGSHSVGCFRFVFRLFVFFAVVVARVAD